MTKIVKARKPHQCSERSYHTIAAGDLYLRCVMTPWHDCNSSRKFIMIKACLRCADEFGLHTSETRNIAPSKEVPA